MKTAMRVNLYGLVAVAERVYGESWLTIAVTVVLILFVGFIAAAASDAEPSDSQRSKEASIKSLNLTRL